MDIDLLVNNNSAIGGIETVDIPTLSFDDIASPNGNVFTPASSAPAPQLAPSINDVGPMSFGGLDNFNASSFSSAAPTTTHRVSEDVLMKEKYEILRKFERLAKLGVPLRKRFTLESPIDEMRLELEFIKREKSMDSTIKQFSEWFVAGMTAMEWGSTNVNMMKAFGLQLNGLSEAAQMNVADMEDDFEELYDMYGENLKMHPLVKIPLRTCQMVYMVHLTNQMAARMPIPNMQEVLRQNPEMARTLASQAMAYQTKQNQQAQPPPQQQSNPLSGLMNFMQGNTVPAPPPSQPNVIPRPPPDNKPIRVGIANARPAAAPPAAQPTLRPPTTNIDDLLKDIRSTVQVPMGPGPPAPIKPRAKQAGSTGKNSVVIKL